MRYIEENDHIMFPPHGPYLASSIHKLHPSDKGGHVAKLDSRPMSGWKKINLENNNKTQ